MKKFLSLFVVFCFGTITVIGGDVIVLYLDQRASASDKVTVRDGLKILLSDTRTVTLEDLSIWRTTNSPISTGFVCAVSLDQVKHFGSTNNLSLSFLDNWKGTHLNQPLYLKWRKGTDALSILKNAGLERVLEEE